MRQLANYEQMTGLHPISVAHAVARLDRITFAIEENTDIVRGGDMADEGQTVWELATKTAQAEWYEDPRYNDVVMYQLKGGITYETVQKAMNPSEAKDKTARLGELAFRDGLVRLGVLTQPQPTATPQISLETVAGLCYKRADIRQPIDRLLYGLGAGTVGDTAQYLAEQVPVRNLELPENYPKTSVYAARFLSETALQATFGVETKQALWWAEIGRDLEEIDRLANELAYPPFA